MGGGGGIFFSPVTIIAAVFSRTVQGIVICFTARMHAVRFPGTRKVGIQAGTGRQAGGGCRNQKSPADLSDSSRQGG